LLVPFQLIFERDGQGEAQFRRFFCEQAQCTAGRNVQQGAPLEIFDRKVSDFRRNVRSLLSQHHTDVSWWLWDAFDPFLPGRFFSDNLFKV
jgi:hypothetical protein